MTGGDFAPLGKEAVTELHKVFDWAEHSKKGTILFVDEADAFLRTGRQNGTMTEDMRNALSAFLYRTGTENSKFMIVLASNIPKSLDAAILDRVDDTVEFELPEHDSRVRLYELYFNKYILGEGSEDEKDKPTPIQIEGFEDSRAVFEKLANLTPGSSMCTSPLPYWF